jgi:16S rRNA G966 N2-methylase RsmD
MKQNFNEEKLHQLKLLCIKHNKDSMIYPLEPMKGNLNHHNDSIYLPVKAGGKIIREGNRRFSNQQYKRLDYFDVENKSVIDFGCNVGYITLECKRKGASYCLGVESGKKDLIKIANLCKEIDNLQNVDFVLNDVIAKQTFNYGWDGEIPSFVKEKLPFDVGFLLSPFSIQLERNGETIGEQSYKCCIEQLKCIINYAKVWYIEPTLSIPKVNKPNNKEEVRDWGLENLKQFGKVEFLGFTDYQERSIFKVVT